MPPLASPREVTAGTQFRHMPGVSLPGGFLNMELILLPERLEVPEYCVVILN